MADPGNGPIFITGSGGFIGHALLQRLCRQPRPLWLLCRPASQQKLKSRLEGLENGNFRIISGDIEQENLGLSPADLDEVLQEAEEIFHLAALYDLSASEERTRAVNVEGTGRVLDLAGRARRLRRLHYVSTMAVAGDFPGLFSEDDLDAGQAFDHAYGRTKFEAERMVRQATDRLPVSIYRPGVVMGDSRTGWAEKIDGPYFVFAALTRLRRLPLITRMPMIVPREQNSFFHLVPVDYVVEGMLALAARPDTVGRTFHLMDPSPPSFRQFYMSTLKLMGFRGPFVSRPVSRLLALLRHRRLWPYTRRALSWAGMPAEMLAHFSYTTTYDTRLAERELAAAGVRCPPFERILPVIIDYFERQMARG